MPEFFSTQLVFTTIFGTTFSMSVGALILTVATLALGVASFFLAPNVGSFEQRLNGLLITQREGISYGRRIFGLTRVGGVITYVDVTDVPAQAAVLSDTPQQRRLGNITYDYYPIISPATDPIENGWLHLVITFAYTEITEFLTVYFDDYPIHMRNLNEEGWVQVGVYGNKEELVVDPSTGQQVNRAWLVQHVNSPVRIQMDKGIRPTNGRVANDGLYGRDALPESSGYPGYVDEADWQPFPRLQNQSPRWTSDHKQMGRAKLYIRLKSDPDTFPGGVPNITVVMKGCKVTDVRDDTVKWSPNPALCVRQLVRGNPTFQAGLGALDDEIDDDSFVAAANVCEERVEINYDQSPYARTFSVITDADLIIPEAADLSVSPTVYEYKYFPFYATNSDGTNNLSGVDFQTGDGFVIDEIQSSLTLLNLGTANSIPNGLVAGTKYYIILKQFGQSPRFDRTRMKAVSSPNPYDFSQFGFHEGSAMCREMYAVGFAATYQDALDDIPIASTVSETNTNPNRDTFIVKMVMTKSDEARYQCSGVFEYDRTFADILEEMLSSFTARLVLAEGKYRLTSYSYVTPQFEFNKDDLVGEAKFTTKLSRRERFNVLTGVYSSPIHAFQPTTYSKVFRQQYIDDDEYPQSAAHHQMSRTLDLPFTNSQTAAQRIARIMLEKSRQEITGTYPVGLIGLRVTAGDTIMITDEDMGWDQKVFEILEWEFSIAEDAEGQPVFTVLLTIKEHASAVFDWTPNTDEAALPEDLANNTNLPTALVVQPPTNLQVSEELFRISSGLGTALRAIITWDAALEPFVREYEVQWKESDESEYRTVAHTTTLTAYLNSTPGIIDFRVRTINTVGVRSSWTNLQQELYGLAPVPSPATNLTVSQLSDALVMISWDKTTDLDVEFGGSVIIRHDEDEFSGDVINSVGIGSKVFPGGSTSAVVPNKSGTYVVLFRDSSGGYSTAATVSHVRADTLSYSTLTTITESTAFVGTRVDLQVIAGELQLAYDTTTSPALDVLGSGTYSFNTGWTSGTAKNVRITTYIDVIIQDNLDSIDGRTEPIDTWPSLDGVLGIECDARVQMRVKQGDPAASPTPVYGNWMNVDCLFANIYNAEFRVVVTSDFGYANIKIGTLYVTIEEVL